MSRNRTCARRLADTDGLGRPEPIGWAVIVLTVLVGLALPVMALAGSAKPPSDVASIPTSLQTAGVSDVGEAGFLSPANVPSGTQAEYVPGELMVEYRAGVPMHRARSDARASSAMVEHTLRAASPSDGRILVLVHSDALTTAELQDTYADDPLVLRSSPNYVRRLCGITPNDEQYPLQWALETVSAPEAWTLTTGSPDVVIADIDTGVDISHPDLLPNLWVNSGEIGGNSIDDDGNGYVDDVYGMNAAGIAGYGNPIDTNGHGTHTAGIIGAVGNNSFGVCGVGWTVKVMALKAFDSSGNSIGEAEDSSLIACIRYAIAQKVDHGVNVVAINASWGEAGDNPFLYDAIRDAGDAGIVVCASAGNGGDDNVGDDTDIEPHYPSGYDLANIISVAATDGSDQLASFSNWGLASVDSCGAWGRDSQHKQCNRPLYEVRQRHLDGGPLRHRDCRSPGFRVSR